MKQKEENKSIGIEKISSACRRLSREGEKISGVGCLTTAIYRLMAESHGNWLSGLCNSL